ncbi:hypothetical protein PNK_0430 [Candidatus Protochlamydia naegleriophila]|uniref:Uncharacterized protein n=1 Tax=Candidatus Protochlamydia naegleriophila TaxID=389348 RepID=A0A0U5JAG6_9BACT|nr:hypothetical protein PNK_0430 [Candidatus Protochlamydia naegleriophila]
MGINSIFSYIVISVSGYQIQVILQIKKSGKSSLINQKLIPLLQNSCSKIAIR